MVGFMTKPELVMNRCRGGGGGGGRYFKVTIHTFFMYTFIIIDSNNI